MRYEFSPKQIARFWARVGKTDTCWLWTGYCVPGGYGSLYIKNNRTPDDTRWRAWMMSAHRVSYLLHYGEIPDDKGVLHRCDNRACVNPEHLWLGNNADNVRDMTDKGRWARGRQGVLHVGAKLSEEDVFAIRAEHRRLINDLAARYGVTRQLIRQIFVGRVWKHVNLPDDL